MRFCFMAILASLSFSVLADTNSELTSSSPPADEGLEEVLDLGEKMQDWVSRPAPGNFYIRVVKNRNELSVRSLSEENKVYKIFHAISGTNAGDKKVEGDNRTPEGIYFIEKKIPQSGMTALHGAAAFGLNYPNPVDKINRQTGYGIWLHGVDNEARLKKRFDTQGCVAVSNEDVLDIGSVLKLKNTPIVIVEDLEAGEKIGIETSGSPFYERVHQWAKAWSSMDLDLYIDFYHEDFRGQKMNRDQWRSYKSRLLKRYEFINVTLSELKILRHGKYSVTVFRQDYESDKFRASSLKRLYWVGEGKNAQILAEEVAEETPGRLGAFSVGSLE